MPKKPKRVAEDWTFILPDERALPPEEQGRFRLSPLTLAERMRVRDERSRLTTTAAGEVIVQSRAWTQLRELVIEHLLSTENVPSDAPSPWPGLDSSREKREKWLDENLEDLDVATIGIEIRDKALFGGELKN